MCRIHDSEDKPGENSLSEANFTLLVRKSPAFYLQEYGRSKRDGTLVRPIILDHATGRIEK